MKIASQNMAGDNARGIVTWLRRRENLYRALVLSGARFWLLQELPVKIGGRAGRSWFDKRAGRDGMVRIAGSYGRYIYARDGGNVVATGRILPAARRPGRPKWITWAIVEHSEHLWLLANFHGETGDKYVELRREWVREGLDELRKIQRRHKVHNTRRIYAGDFNGHGEIRRAMGDEGMVDRCVSPLKSYNGWKEPKRGKRIHMIFTDASRPTVSAQVHRHNLADSALQIAELRRL